MTTRKIGLQINEVDIPEAQVVVPSETTNTGVLVISERGAAARPTKVTNPSQLRKKYGNPRNGEYGVLGIESIFEDALPYSLNVYVSRVVASDAVVAAPVSALTAGAMKLQSLKKTSGTSVAIWAKVEAGTDAGTKKITIQDHATTPVVSEVYDNLTADLVVGAINFGQGGYTKSTLAKVVVYGDVLPDNITTTASVLNSNNALREVSFDVAAATVPVLKAGQKGAADPGAWANNYAYQILRDEANPNQRTLLTFKKVEGSWIQVGEPITGLTEANWVKKINDIGGGSDFVYVSTSGSLPDPFYTPLPLKGGEDGTAPAIADMIGVSADKTGIYSFFDTPIQALTSFDVYMDEDATVEWAQEADQFCELVKKRCIATLTVPESYDTEKLEYTTSTTAGITWKSLLRPKSYFVAYKGWIDVKGDNNLLVRIPGVGKILGTYWVRRMLSDTGLPSVAPGGQNVTLRNVFSMDVPNYNDDDLAYLTREVGVNVLMFIAGVGYVVRTSRTMSTINKNYDIHKRRSMHFFGDIFQRRYGYLEQKPNTPEERKRLVQDLLFLLQGYYNKGMFDTSKGFKGAVAIKADGDNNTEETGLLREMNCLVAMRFVNVTELANLNIANVERSLTIEEL